jgi:NAD(P)-dependent dehydrogenase (short-subunit alcohol dehydrogenase family)
MSTDNTSTTTKTALITGGGTGIGRAAAIALAAEGYAITVAGRTTATLKQTVKLIEDAGGTATYVIADVHDENAVRHAVEVAAGSSADGGPGEGGRLDVAVNSAGVDGGNDSHPFIDYPVETLDLMLATNVRGMFFATAPATASAHWPPPPARSTSWSITRRCSLRRSRLPT